MRDLDFQGKCFPILKTNHPIRLLLPFLLLFLAVQPLWSPAHGQDTGSGLLSTGVAATVPAPGTVRAWGANTYGQLGNGTLEDLTIPFQVLNLTDVFAVSAGGNHSLALKNDGTVWAWGSNESGQLGDGTIIDRKIPVQVRSDLIGNYLTDVIGIAAGGSHSLALKADGTVWAWGLNESGQLGDGTTTDWAIPVQVFFVLPDTNITAIAGGGSHSLALGSDGTVWAWGLNESGQLGDQSTTNRSVPVQIPTDTLLGVKAIAAGGNHSLALKNDSTVYAWGLNSSGQLGNQSSINRSTPVKVVDLAGISTIAAGENHSLAGYFGAVWGWGANDNGQLGDGSVLSRSYPAPTDLVATATFIAAGGNHSLAASASPGRVWSWGLNDNGQLGNGNVTTQYSPQTIYPFFSGIPVVAAGGNHSLAFTPAPYPLYVNITGSGHVGSAPAGIDCGGVSDICREVFDVRSTVTLTATAGTGFVFTGWNVSKCKGIGQCKVKMNSAKVVGATFLPAHTMTVSGIGAGTGTITSTPKGIACGDTCAVLFPATKTVKLTAKAAKEAQFAGWSGDCTNTKGTCSLAMSVDRTVTALFTSEPNIAVSPATKTFKTAVKVGKVSSAASITVSNKGSQPLTITQVSLEGIDKGEFVVKKDTCSDGDGTVAAGKSCKVSIVFVPSSAGSKTAQLRIVSDDPDTATIDMPLTGTAVEP